MAGQMINVTVRLFGPAVDMVGAEELQYALAPPATIETLTSLLYAKYPRLAANAAFVRIAVNEEYADPARELKEGDDIAVIPPVAGGSAEVVLTREPIDVDSLISAVAAPAAGAVVTFQGVVRQDGGRDNPLTALEYSAYEAMAGRQIRKLLAEAKRKFRVHDAAVLHRLGRLEVGAVAVAIAVSAAHREAAFDACRWLIDRLKADVPIWKREYWARGEPTWAAGNT